MSERTLADPASAAEVSWDQVTMTATASPGQGSDGPDAGSGKPKSPKKARQKPIISFSKRMELEEARAARHAGEPDNWFSRKAMVGVVLALVIWSYYVVVGRVCAPMIQRQDNAGGSLGEGVGLLIGFNILWLLFMWTYLKLILTDPGFAKKIPELVSLPEESGRSTAPPNGMANAPIDVLSTDVPGHGATAQDFSTGHGNLSHGAIATDTTARDASPSSVAGMYTVSEDGADRTLDAEDDAAADRAGTLDGLRNLWPAELPVVDAVGSANDGGNEASRRERSDHARAEHFHPSEPRISQGHTIASAHTALSSTGLLGNSGPAANTHAPTPHAAASSPKAGCLGSRRPQIPPQDLDWPFPPTRLGRAWCQHCQIWKPDRAHHCRHCGQCVLAMDHHCPWVGQCVGWQNRKFFVTFCGWSTAFTSYVIAVLIATMAKRTSVDGQMIALAAIAGFFTIFTVMMTISQIQLMASALTTIESYAIRSQRDRERATLASQYGFCGYGKKVKAKRKWSRDWGDMATEGNRWWTGGMRREIEQVMSSKPLGWLLPVGRPLGDGMSYEQNPRFGPGGIRRKREEWPEALR